MGVFDAKCVCVGLRLVYMWGVGSPGVRGMSVYGQVHVPNDTSKPVV
jgi:hypothetical protein